MRSLERRSRSSFRRWMGVGEIARNLSVRQPAHLKLLGG